MAKVGELTDGEAATRIYLEVLKGKYSDPKDSAVEKNYREQIKKSVETIRKDGGVAEIPKEWL